MRRQILRHQWIGWVLGAVGIIWFIASSLNTSYNNFLDECRSKDNHELVTQTNGSFASCYENTDDELDYEVVHNWKAPDRYLD